MNCHHQVTVDLIANLKKSNHLPSQPLLNVLVCCIDVTILKYGKQTMCNSVPALVHHSPVANTNTLASESCEVRIRTSACLQSDSELINGIQHCDSYYRPTSHSQVFHTVASEVWSQVPAEYLIIYLILLSKIISPSHSCHNHTWSLTPFLQYALLQGFPGGYEMNYECAQTRLTSSITEKDARQWPEPVPSISKP